MATTHTPRDGYFKVGDRVQLHPSLDRWMRGDRYGTVVKIGREFVHVTMDRSGNLVRFGPGHLELVTA